MHTALKLVVIVTASTAMAACSPAMKLANDATDGNVAAVKADLAKTPVDAADAGETALGFAAANGRLEIVKVLLAAGAKVDAADDTGATPLMNAAASKVQGGDYPAVVAALIAAGANVNAKDKVGNTAIGNAAMLGEPGVVPALARAGAHLNEPAPVLTPLEWAAFRGDLPMMTALIDAGADVNPPDGLHDPLDEATSKGNLAAMQFLISKGAKVNGNNPYNTPLDTAAMLGQLAVVQALLDAGADPNKGHFTPLRLAREGGHGDVAALLAQHGGHP